MHARRLHAYLAGGRPTGASRTYPGCRDSRPPARSLPVELPGTLYFAQESPVWTGGRAFYDPAGEGRVRGRAHLLSVEQFSDIAAQEMYEEPGLNLDLSVVLAQGRDQRGAGRYETLVRPGDLDGLPLLTFTAPWAVTDVVCTEPSAGYLRHLAEGLLEAGAWSRRSIAEYLASCPGALGHWSADDVESLIAR
ncbi:histone deacetylase [Streptomyces sp. T-3]|nr:histone deacetylase [Streptomyces sp. T-3]